MEWTQHKPVKSNIILIKELKKIFLNKILRLLPQCRRCIWMFLSEYPYKMKYDKYDICSFEWTFFFIMFIICT